MFLLILIKSQLQYLFSISSSTQCQQIPSSTGYAFGYLKLSDSSFFMLSYDPSTPYKLHLFHATFSNTSPNWSCKLSCPSGTCLASNSESLLSPDSSKIYSLFIYGSGTKPLYLVTFSVFDGSVISNRYKSSIGCGGVFGSTIQGDYIISSVLCSSYCLLIYNTITNAFSIKSFTGTNLFGLAVEQCTGRIVAVGVSGPNGYTNRN